MVGNSEYHILEMVRMNYTQVFKVILKLGAKLDVKSTKRLENLKSPH